MTAYKRQFPIHGRQWNS